MTMDPRQPFRAEELMQHLPALRGLARALVRGDDVEDLLAATMLRAVERPPRHRANPRAWLARTLRNLAADHGRRASTKREKEPRLRARERETELPPTPDDILARSEALRCLHSTLDQLDDPDRHVLLLRYFEGLNATEIGARLQLQAPAVRARLSRSLGRLRAKLRERYGRDAFAPCFLLLEPLSKVAVPAAATGGAVSLVPLLFMKKSLVLLLPILVLTTGYFLLRDHSEGDSSTEPTLAQHGTGAAEPPLEDAGAISVAIDSDLRRQESGVSASAQKVFLVDDRGRSLAKHRVQVYFEGSGYARVSGGDGGFDWPEALEQGGLVLVWSQGRVPHWQWWKPSESGAQLLVPDGRCIRVKAEYTAPAGELTPTFTLDFSPWTPQPGNDGFRYRQHAKDARGEGLVDPASLYTSVAYMNVDAQGYCEFRGLPEKGPIALALRSPFFDWQGATQDGDFQKVMVGEDEFDVTAELELRPLWTARLIVPEAHRERVAHNLHLDLAQVTRLDLEVHTRLAEEWIELWIPQTPDLPVLGLADAWQAELWAYASGTRVSWNLELPRNGGNLGDFEFPPERSIPVLVETESGDPITGARVESGWTDAAALVTDIHGRVQLSTFAAQSAADAESVILSSVSAEGFQTQDYAVHPLANGELRIILQHRSGLRVLCRLAHDGKAVEGEARVSLSCEGTRDSELHGLFGRVLSEEEEQAWIPGNLVRGQRRANGELFTVVGESAARDNYGRPVWFEVMQLAPSTPVTLTVQFAGHEVYSEVFDPWPTGKLVERVLDLEVPQTSTVHGFVRDNLGNRVPEARVWISSSTNSLSCMTDAFGEFRLTGVIEPEFKLHVAPDGLRWLRLEDFPASTKDTTLPLELVVGRAHSLLVKLSLSDGSPLNAPSLVATRVDAPGAYAFAERLSLPGQFRLGVAKGATLRMQAKWQGVTYYWVVEANVDEVSVHAPAVFPVHVDWSAVELPKGTWLHLHARDPEQEGKFSIQVELAPRPGDPGVERAGSSSALVFLPTGNFKFTLFSQDLDTGVSRQVSSAFSEQNVHVGPGQPTELRFRPRE
jgi:RNA polymerase sigma factor (sigma-70 family)